MKRVLFIGVTRYDLEKNLHLKVKFEGLSRGVKPYILAKGRFSHKKIWGAAFYLLPPSFFWLLAPGIAFWLCLMKKIDIIIAQSPLTEGFLGTIIKKIFKKELIIEIHGDWLEGPFLSKKRRLEFIQRKFIPVLAKISFKNADKVRAVASNLLKEVESTVQNKQCFIFPTFTDLDVFLNEKDARLGKSILFVGHTEKVKGLDYLIEAFKKIRVDFPEFNLVLIGQGTESVKGSGIESKGRLSLEQTRDVMKDCYCLVLPSLSEGLPRVIMEAMALSKPVIASNVGGVPDLVKEGESGFLAKPGDVNSLAEKLKAVLSDKSLAERMGEQGRRLIQDKFSNQRYIENYLKMMYSEV